MASNSTLQLCGINFLEVGQAMGGGAISAVSRYFKINTDKSKADHKLYSAKLSTGGLKSSSFNTINVCAASHNIITYHILIFFLSFLWFKMGKILLPCWTVNGALFCFCPFLPCYRSHSFSQTHWQQKLLWTAPPLSAQWIRTWSQ